MTINFSAPRPLILALMFCGTLSSCKDNASEKDQASFSTSNAAATSERLPKKSEFEQTSAFKDYWYAGEAEISSYTLKQARYGELREGQAVLVFVTEPFLKEKQVKADNANADNIPVLKLNATKTFTTGIYPYAIMQSTFYPVANTQHALKVSCSIQEWCGHVYSQLNNRDQFEVTSHSYFENEADENFKLSKALLENEIWTQLRLEPSSLPVGEIKMIPAFEFISLKHVTLKAYDAKAVLNEGNYSITYPELERKISINFNPQFPYDITSWEETFNSGFGDRAETLTTTATKLNTIKSAYWNKNNNSDAGLRETLQLN